MKSRALLAACCAAGVGCESQVRTFELATELEPLDPSCDLACDPPEATGDPYITTQRCDAPGGDAHLVRIDRNRPDSEIWVIEQINDEWGTATNQTHPVTDLHGAHLDDETLWTRSRASVQINGYLYECDPLGPLCNDFSFIPERPRTEVYESTHQLSSDSYASRVPPYPASLVRFGSVWPRLQVDLLPTALHRASSAYNAVQSSIPALSDGKTCAETPAFDVGDEEQSAIGYDDQSVVMAQFERATRQQVCHVLECQHVRGAMMLDGGGSSGIYLRTPAERRHGNTGRNIAYRLGLVTLGGELIRNGGFEAPNLEAWGGGNPGRHSFAGEQVPNQLGWTSGAAWVYNSPLLFEQFKRYVPSNGSQAAALHPHGLPTDFLAQAIETPRDRYCMLHFWHGYQKPTGCQASQSLLEVTVREDHPDGSLRTISTYWSDPTTAGLHEEWLRFLTSTDVTVVKFRAADDQAQGNCEVLLDDVSVRCASIPPSAGGSAPSP